MTRLVAVSISNYAYGVPTAAISSVYTIDGRAGKIERTYEIPDTRNRALKSQDSHYIHRYWLDSCDADGLFFRFITLYFNGGYY